MSGECQQTLLKLSYGHNGNDHFIPCDLVILHPRLPQSSPEFLPTAAYVLACVPSVGGGACTNYGTVLSKAHVCVCVWAYVHILYYRWQDDRIGNAEGWAYSSSGLYFGKEEWAPEQFVYLLSKGFDLFGLIESGLAITSPK